MTGIRIRRAISALLCCMALAVAAAAAYGLDNEPKPAPGGTQAPQIEPALLPPPDPNNFHDSVVAVVNDKPISEYDVEQRMALVMSTSNLPNTAEMRKRVRDEVVEQLETEMIQRQEALKNDITVSSVEVDKDIQGILTDNHMTMDQLRAVLAKGHVQIATLRAQLASQLLWQKAVQAQYADRVHITPEQVDNELARIREGADKTHYLVSEIFLPVDNPDQDEKEKKDADNLEKQLQAGAPFQAIARQFSQSPSAAQGGDLGLIYDGQLAPELSAALEKMNSGDISAPIRSAGGYYILQLRQRLEAANVKIPEQPKPGSEPLPDELPLTRILLPMPPKVPPQILDNAMKIAGAIRDHITSCEMIPKLMTEVKGAVIFPMGMTKLSDMNQQIRDALAKTTAGEVAEPFQSAAGIEIFARCDKAAPVVIGFKMPSREQVENELFSDQISAMARRYQRDLRRDADIETR